MVPAADFSKQGTKKALLRETLLFPVTLYSFGAGILGLLALALFGPTVVTGLWTLGAFVLCSLSWTINYFVRADVYLRRHIESIQKIIENEKAQLTERIGKGLEQLNETSATKEFVRQAKAQFPIVAKSFDSFKGLLAQKFEVTEITYGRYLGAAEQIYLSILDQLDHTVALFKSLESTDLKHAEARIKELSKKGDSLSADDNAEKIALEKRIAIFQANLKEIDVMLSRNEEALTSLEMAKASIAALRTSKGQASTELPHAMRDLEDLAQRAKQYSIHSKQ